MRLYRRIALGAEAGALAGVSVILLFFVQDAVRLAPLATPNVLAGNLFGPAAYQYDTAMVGTIAALAGTGFQLVAYTVLHLLTFAVMGVGASFLFRGSSWVTALGGGALFGATVCTGVFYGSRFVMESPLMMDALTLPSVVVANLVAGVVMGGGLYLASSDNEPEATPAAA